LTATGPDVVMEIKCFICDVKIPISTQNNIESKLPLEVLNHVRKIEHIERRKELEKRIKQVPEGGMSVLGHWRQYLNDKVTASV
jgi:hypothetical protein